MVVIVTACVFGLSPSLTILMVTADVTLPAVHVILTLLQTVI